VKEVAGVVVELGFGTAGVAVGDEVYGLADAYRDGAAAGLVAIEARDIAPKTASVDHVVALDQAGWENEIGEVDLVFDTIGGDILERSPAIVRPGGALISVVVAPPTTRTDIKSLAFVREQSGSQLREIAALVDAGQIRPQVGAVYPLARGREAFAAKSAPGIPGRVILQP